MLTGTALFLHIPAPVPVSYTHLRSLNNFVECLLMDAMYTEPNEETKAAIEEARAGKNLKKVGPT